MSIFNTNGEASDSGLKVYTHLGSTSLVSSSSLTIPVESRLTSFILMHTGSGSDYTWNGSSQYVYLIKYDSTSSSGFYMVYNYNSSWSQPSISPPIESVTSNFIITLTDNSVSISARDSSIKFMASTNSTHPVRYYLIDTTE